MGRVLAVLSLVASASYAGPAAPAKDREQLALFARMCREQHVLSFRVAPEPGKPEEAATRAERDRKQAAKALGKGVSAQPDPEGGLAISWDKPAGTMQACRRRLSGLAARFPGRLSPARKPSERMREAQKRMEGRVPDEVRKDPKEDGVLAGFFDRLASRGRPGTVEAGLRDAPNASRSVTVDQRPRTELPRSYRRRASDPPEPQPRRRRRSFGQTLSDGYRGARDTAGRVVRRSADAVTEAYRGTRAGIGDAISGISKAVGAPWSGGLRGGVQLPKSGPGYRFVRYGQWGTDRLVNGIRFIGRQLAQSGEAMEVGDMSYKHGGPIRRHRSHQNGRDVDLFFVGGSGRGFDTAANWTLLRSALDNPFMQVSNVFIATNRKQQLLNYARRIKDPMAHRAASVMSYEPGHHDHFHIRIL